MKLRIWTAASAAQIKPVFGTGLKSMKPDIIPHEFIPVDEDIPIPHEGEVVLVCGAKALTMMQKAGLMQKGRTVNYLRETALQPPGVEGHYFVTFDPNVVNSEPEKLEIMHWDLQLVARFMRTGSLKPIIGKYWWVPDFMDLIQRIEANWDKTGKPTDVVLDTETMGLDPYNSKKDFVSIGFTDRPGFGESLYLGPKFDPCPLTQIEDPEQNQLAQIRWLLTSEMVKLKGANLKYDLNWIAIKLGIECTNFSFDTMLVGSLLNENRSNSLNIHAKIMTAMGGYDDELNDKYDKGHMEDIPPHDLDPYANGDLDACYQCAEVLKEELLEDPELAKFYITVLHPAARAFEKIERRGVWIDREKYEKLGDDLRTELDTNYGMILELLPNKLKIKYRDKIEHQLAEGKDPITPKIKKEFFFGPLGLNLKPKMFTEKTEEAKLNLAHLKMFDHPDAVAMLKAMEAAGSASKTKSTFVDGFLKCVREDGLLHPSYMLFKGAYNDDAGEDASGTVTGRLSAKDPAFQTLPKKTKWAKRIRECYIAPPGKKIVSFDYSQGELRIVACIANEKTMLKAYEDGLDLHAVTGAKLGGIELEEFLSWKKHHDEKKQAMFADLRGKAKPANFGLLYGMGALGFQAYAWANYGLALSDKEAEEMRNAFFDLYTGLTDYHTTQKNFVRLHEHVRSPLGRVRHLPTIKAWDKKIKSGAERQAINSPVQATLSDMMLWAIANIEAELGEDCAMVGMIHDAFVGYMDEARIEELAPQVSSIMSNLPLHELGWYPQLQFPADGEAGYDLAHMEPLDLAA